MYQPYVDRKYYVDIYKGTVLKDENIDKYLKQASRHIDTLTFNRVVGSFNELTQFQTEIVQEVLCELADFEYENRSILSSVLSYYGINGVNMSFGDSWNIKIVNGVAIRQDLYDQLSQTSLTSRNLL